MYLNTIVSDDPNEVILKDEPTQSHMVTISILAEGPRRSGKSTAILEILQAIKASKNLNYFHATLKYNDASMSELATFTIAVDEPHKSQY